MSDGYLIGTSILIPAVPDFRAVVVELLRRVGVAGFALVVGVLGSVAFVATRRMRDDVRAVHNSKTTQASRLKERKPDGDDGVVSEGPSRRAGSWLSEIHEFKLRIFGNKALLDCSAEGRRGQIS